MTDNTATHQHLEEMRKELAHLLKRVRSLTSEVELLKQLIAEETEAKYRAYVKVADLTKKLSNIELSE